MVETCGGTPNTITTPTTKGFITDTACSSAHVLWTPGHVIRMGREGNTPHNGDVVESPPQDNGLVLIGDIFVPPTMGNSGSQDIIKKRKSTSPSVGRKCKTFDASVDRNLNNDRDSVAIFRKVLGCELSGSLLAKIYSRSRVDFTSNAIATEAPDFVHLGLPTTNASDERNPFDTPATRIIRLMYGSHCYALGLVFGEFTAVVMSGTRSEQNYSQRSNFETRRENQEFGHKNISMSQLTLG